ncbi:carboxylesterase family protein [Sphaerisporangium sp. NPDC051011]|uniref:carboxylesterase/lipase family protein n=1 Tax=Sphaerisporangium sp. NPDC051011 TaxID=3155792 RepID=UPI0033C2022D
MTAGEHKTEQGVAVEVRSGRRLVRGRRQGGVDAYRGIPYAAPPVGSRRFAPAAPIPDDHDDVDRTVDATMASPSFPQPPSRVERLMGRPSGTYDEARSLTLNIWTPTGATNRPVLFWLHGGASVSGSASWDWYDGARLAATGDIVVVTANYRLGALGYLDLRDLESGSESCANAGLSDQMTALEWVAANIASFGGDPSAITVGGQSAGAESAVLLAGSSRTGRLVRRLFLQSGGSHGWVQPPQQSESLAAEYLAVLGESVDHPVRLDSLRSLPVDALLDAQVEFLRRRALAGDVNPPFGVAGAVDVPTGGTKAFLRARPELDVLAGWTRDELQGFARLNPAGGSISDTEVISALAPRFGDGARTLLEHYRSSRPDARPADLLSAINGDAVMMAPLLDLAAERTSADASTFLYRFDWSGSEFGACHCVDLPFLFGTFDRWMPGAAMLGHATPDDLGSVAQQFMEVVGSFVRSGVPRLPGLEWSCWAKDAGVARIGGQATTVERGLGLRERDLLASSARP